MFCPVETVGGWMFFVAQLDVVVAQLDAQVVESAPTNVGSGHPRR